MATPKLNYTINLNTNAGIQALKSYARNLKTEDPKEALKAEDTLADVLHERAKAERRAKAAEDSMKSVARMPTAASLNQPAADTVSISEEARQAAREAEAEEDTDQERTAAS
jgi:hypothetical protein